MSVSPRTQAPAPYGVTAARIETQQVFAREQALRDALRRKSEKPLLPSAETSSFREEEVNA